jgi:hypothetical protein
VSSFLPSLLRVVVHSSSTLPLVDEHGFDMQPNSATNIAFHLVNYIRQRSPYGTCITSWDDTGVADILTGEHGELPYTQGVRTLWSMSL